jgi:hypothetical protein
MVLYRKRFKFTDAKDSLTAKVDFSKDFKINKNSEISGGSCKAKNNYRYLNLHKIFIY